MIRYVHNVRVDGTSASGRPIQARVRMVAQPASVPAARRFVDDALTGWGNRQLVDDVCLCVTELSTNAMLHSASHYFEIELQKIADAVRVSVLDAGRVSADSIAARTEFSDALAEIGREA